MINFTKENASLCLFRSLLARLDEEKEELGNSFQLAYNLACSELGYEAYTHILVPYKILPEKTDVLKKNIALFTEELSLKRYLLIKAFQSLVPNAKDIGGIDCFDYWENKIGKLKPSAQFELKDRFKE